MISAGHLIGFTLASLVIIVIPGPGVLFVGPGRQRAARLVRPVAAPVRARRRGRRPGDDRRRSDRRAHRAEQVKPVAARSVD
jgi:hypothetical protein